jgi:hypothetical protein
MHIEEIDFHRNNAEQAGCAEILFEMELDQVCARLGAVSTQERFAAATIRVCDCSCYKLALIAEEPEDFDLNPARWLPPGNIEDMGRQCRHGALQVGWS